MWNIFCQIILKYIYIYSGILIFRSSKGNENWFEKSGVWKNPGWHQITPVLPWYCFIRYKKADNNGISLLLMCELSYLPTKHAFKTKSKFKDLSQFWRDKNQYCTDTCVCNFAQTLDCISFPLLYQKKVPCTPRFKETPKFINVLWQELEKCN